MTSQPLPNDPREIKNDRPNRRKIEQIMEIEWGSSILTSSVRDIGPKGLFVELTPPLWLGATFSARLMLNPPIQLICTVCRVEPSTGMGVTFSMQEEDGIARLEKLLATLPKI